MIPKVAPSVLSADFGELNKEIQLINKSSAYSIHVDVMDGVFVPNISFGQPIVKTLSLISNKPLDVHLMIVDPIKFIDEFVFDNTLNITIHYESTNKIEETLDYIKSKNIKSGLAIKPNTEIDEIESYIQKVDILCLMSVNPGFSGQNFIENTYTKLKQLRKLIEKKKLSTLIQIDGGVNNTNAKKLFRLGADILVSGNYIFKSANPNKVIEYLNNLSRN
ncbi:MAG: ribulose-phosphate 3-epimerase [Bacteroidota bacterium]|nr:ribulose-phosphate 3-epimerase [Bacteroidota bacterium]|tara:strand:+ start:330 stop:989 length:660 start_codon:yes stop_codon:yes gene_type:complete